MPTKTAMAFLFAAVAGLATSAARAHHSWAADYDLSRSTSISGTVARVLIQYPHSTVVLDVDAESGRRERWTIEWQSPERLRARGITEQTMRVGDALLVTGNPHRDANVRSVRGLSLRRADGAEIGSEIPERDQPGVPNSAR